MHIVRPLLTALFVCTTAAAHAQPPQQPTPAADAAPEDERTQYPAFMANSFFTFSVGAIGYLFGERQLKPGFQVEEIDKPRLSVRGRSRRLASAGESVNALNAEITTETAMVMANC